MGSDADRTRIGQLTTAPDHRNGPPVGTAGIVRQVAPPPAARALSTLSRVDYADTFLVQTAPSQGRTGEQWARATLEGAPAFLQKRLLRSWFALGLKLGPAQADGFVLGWEIRRSTPDYALLAAGSRVGMPAELLFKPQQHTVLFATFVQQQNPVVRAMWRAIVPTHRHVVSYLLQRAVRPQPPANGEPA